MEKQIEITEDMINLVIARLRTIPENAQLSVGSDEEKSLTSEDLIREVRNQTEIGKKVVETQLFYLRSLKDLPVEEYA
ncbi:MAG: hypothetical protein AAB569_01370 [Patescibacteria group bacterium]